jgi:hypothetical protein
MIQLSTCSGLSIRIQDDKIGNSSSERVEYLTYLGKTLNNQNSIEEEIKSRLNSGNAC